MPNLVAAGLSIRDVRARKTQFKRVRIGQIFYSERRWYQRKSPRTAIRADVSEVERVYFLQTTWVRVFDETKPTHRRLKGMSFDEFINQAACE